MPRSRLLQVGLGIAVLLLAMGCAAVRDVAGPLFERSDLLTWPPDVPTPSPWLQFETPGLLTPFSLATPETGPTPAPISPTPTSKPSPTPLPTATPIIPLDQLRRTPAPTTRVFGHGIRLPQGFEIDVYAQDLSSASYMAYSPDGVLFVSLPGRGAVVALPDQSGRGRSDGPQVYVEGLTKPSGLAFFGGYLYVAEAQQVVRFPYKPGQLRATAAPEVVVRDLPVGGSNTDHAIGFGPDQRLYVTVPATCNACREADYRRATVMRYEPDGSHEEVFVQGLRCGAGITWYPNSRYPLVSNCSRRLMGDDLPPDTIELTYPEANFGWPFCHAGDIVDPDLGWPEACDSVPAPFAQLPAHTTPRGLCVYQGSQFPEDYYGSIFVALHGSWERRVPVGYEIVRLKVEEGRVVEVEPFASGWLAQEQCWGRPTDVIQAPDGSLLVSDDWAGAIYRISYEDQ